MHSLDYVYLPSQKRVKLFYIVFPLPHGGITVCTRQYPYPTTYLLDTFQSVPAVEYFTSAGELGMEVGITVCIALW